MKKILDFIKKYYIYIIIMIVLLIGIFFFLLKNNQETKLTNILKNMGISFYEDFYYEKSGIEIEAKVEYLSAYKDTGIKINLDNLSKYNSEENAKKLKNFWNRKTKESCSLEDTKVIIYPREPYGKTDYEIKTILDCGFTK